MSAMVLDDLWVEQPRPSGSRALVRGVSLSLEPGRVLGANRPSAGAGKTLTACALSGLFARSPPCGAGKSAPGRDRALDLTRPQAWRGSARQSSAACCSRGAGAALDPLMKVSAQIQESLAYGPGHGRRPGLAKKAVQALERFGLDRGHCQALPPPAKRRHAPAECCWLWAWALRPQVLIADEPTNGPGRGQPRRDDPACFNPTHAGAGARALFAHQPRPRGEWPHWGRSPGGDGSGARVVEQGQAAELLTRPSHPPHPFPGFSPLHTWRVDHA